MKLRRFLALCLCVSLLLCSARANCTLLNWDPEDGFPPLEEIPGQGGTKPPDGALLLLSANIILQPTSGFQRQNSAAPLSPSIYTETKNDYTILLTKNPDFAEAMANVLRLNTTEPATIAQVLTSELQTAAANGMQNGGSDMQWQGGPKDEYNRPNIDLNGNDLGDFSDWQESDPVTVYNGANSWYNGVFKLYDGNTNIGGSPTSSLESNLLSAAEFMRDWNLGYASASGLLEGAGPKSSVVAAEIDWSLCDACETDGPCPSYCQ